MNNSVDESVLYAQKYIEDLLSFFGINLEVSSSLDEDVIQIDIPSTHLNGFLIGQHGDNMRAFQYLTSTALKNQQFSYFRVNIDIANYKKQRAERLLEKAQTWIEQVKESKQPLHLEPMNSADRREIHKFAADNNIKSESVGFGKDRHIVLEP